MPTSSRAGRGTQQRLGARQALARHVQQLALRDHAVECRRDVDRHPLARQRDGTLLAETRTPGVAQAEQRRVRPEATQQRLCEQHAQVGGPREQRVARGLAQIAPAGGHAGAQPGQRLRQIEAERGALVRALVEGRDPRQKLGSAARSCQRAPVSASAASSRPKLRSRARRTAARANRRGSGRGSATPSTSTGAVTWPSDAEGLPAGEAGGAWVGASAPAETPSRR